MDVEVLVATMKQKDINKYFEMNLKSAAILANQDNRNEVIIESIDGKKVKMITTPDRGVGKNRNIAILNSTADIILFADDDMIYEDNYVEIVKEAFNKLPQADIIIFNIETIGEETRSRRINKSIKKLSIYNVLNYGAARIAIRRKSLEKSNIWFSVLYGGGAPYSSGEDSLFLTDAIKKGMKIYTYPKKIANVRQDQSTWFTGYNEKYFYDRGIWLANAFPILKYIFSIYFSYKLKDTTNEFSIIDIYKIINRGIKDF